MNPNLNINSQDDINANLITWDTPESSPAYRCSVQTEQNTLYKFISPSALDSANSGNSFEFISPSALDLAKSGNSFEGLFNEALSLQTKPKFMNKSKPILEMQTSAPLYDNFQPMFAHFSHTKSVSEMVTCVEKVLELLVDHKEEIDFYKESQFVFAGRSHSKYEGCEFSITIFSSSDAKYKSVIEIRRCRGDVHSFADTERSVLLQLNERGALKQETVIDQWQSDEEDFSLPDELPHYDLGMGDIEEFDLCEEVEQPEEISPSKYLELTFDKKVFRTETRVRVLELRDQIYRSPTSYKAVYGVITEFILFIENTFDAFLIKAVLECIVELMKVGVQLPDGFVANIKLVQAKWQAEVCNEISPGVSFHFAPSQQIGKQCNRVVNLFNANY